MNNLGFGLTALALMACGEEEANMETGYNAAGYQVLQDTLEETNQMLEETREALDRAEERIAEIEGDYVKSDDITDLATESWVESQDFADDTDITEAMSGVITKDWIIDRDYAFNADVQENAAAIGNIQDDYVKADGLLAYASKNDHEDLKATVKGVENKVDSVNADYVRTADISTLAKKTDLDQVSSIASNNRDATLANKNALLAIESDYLKSEVAETMVTTDWIAAQSFVSGEDFGNLSAQIDANQTHINVNSAAIDAIEAGQIRSEDLVGYATQDWVSQQSFLDINDMQSLVDETELDALQNQVTAIENNYVRNESLSDYATYTWIDSQNYSTDGIPGLSNFLSVDPERNAVIFSGVNVHIQNGEGSTNGPVNGLGNLIVGYDENNGAVESGSANDKTGSHNIVMGMYHDYIGYGGLVSGYMNELNANNAIVFGDSNRSSAEYGAVLGGKHNESMGLGSTIIGGHSNQASANYSTVSGGQFNDASGQYSAISGGSNNESSGQFSTVHGGDAITVNVDKGVN